MARGTAKGASRHGAQSRFATIPSANIPRSAFDRSHGVKTTFDGGYLVPIYRDEALPGDTITCQPNFFARLSTPLFPTMDNMWLETFFFAVPIRLIWNNFRKMMGEQDNPADSIDFIVPTMSAPASTGYATGDLQDHLGVPIGIADLEHSALYTRAYNLIWNEWFRDENLQDSVTVDKDDGPDDPADYVLLRRGKRHDYFTSCLPFLQKGTAVDLPLGTSAPVVSAGDGKPSFTMGTATAQLQAAGGGATFSAQFERLTGTGPNSGDDATWLATKLETDLSAATAATINQIREAFQIQRLLERDARGGTRYTEIIRSHFGVVSPDMRLQRPEYLGGSSTRIQINPVENSSGFGTQGRLAAYGVAGQSASSWTKSFTEHCIILGFASVRAELTYQQGLAREFSRSTRYDFFWPAFAHLGEQAVLNKEIFAQGDANDDLVFGYQERYAEYRYKPSEIHGLFRSDAVGSIDPWHLSIDFASLPLLNATFIEDNPPIDRVIAVPSEPHFLFDAWYQQKHVRPMPTYGVPGLVDHF